MNSQLFLLRKFLLKYRVNVYQISLSYLTGRFVNEVSGKDKIQSLADFWAALFSMRNAPLNVLTWIALGLCILTYICILLLNRWRRNNNDFYIIQQIKERVIAPDILEFVTNQTAWGSCLTLQKTPNAKQGWDVQDIRINENMLTYTVKDQIGYNEFYTANFDAYRFFNDGTKFMLSKNPASTIDTFTLSLDLEKCKFSEVQYYKEVVVKDEVVKHELIDSMLTSLDIEFPHSLCLHLIVVTKDKKILLTKRSSKVRYHPSTWSVSLEEQFDEKDLQNTVSRGIMNLFSRALSEELGLSNEHYSFSNCKVLSVFLEGDIMNVSLCGVVHLEIDSIELDQMLKVRVPPDYEFDKWAFLTWDELKKELNPDILDTYEYHPSSKYRMLMALIYTFGTWQITDDIKNWERD